MHPTTPSIPDLLAALPPAAEELDEFWPAGEQLRGLLAELSQKPVPTGRLQRLWSLGSLQAKIAAAYLAWWLRSGFLTSEARREGLNETHVAMALAVLGRMSYLRGAIMKVGQVLAHWPDVLPEAFSEVLGRLHSEAPPMHYALVRETLIRELGADPFEIFDEFETEAFAAASLGQVHRARLKKDGRRVAIKVQYPDIDRTISSDLANLKAAAFPMRLSGEWQNLLEQFEGIARMLAQEVDYTVEARLTEKARVALAELDGVLVPEVIQAFSTKRVLVTEYIEGLHLKPFLRTNPTQERRDLFGRRLSSAAFRLWYGARLVYADPHPGNVLFLADGRLGLIDFGCCHEFSSQEFTYVMEVEAAALSNDSERLKRALALGCQLEPSELEGERLQKMLDYCNWVWEPVRTDAEFDYQSPQQFRPGVDLYGEFVRRRWTRSQPVNVWLTKLFFGQRALLTHLGARVPYGKLMRAESARARA